MPPALRGNARIDYEGSFQFASIQEDSETYAEQRVFRHDVTYRAEFSPIVGLAINLGLPTTPDWRMDYPSARQMAFVPTTGSGTFANGDELDEPPFRTASGLQGIWIGAAASPFSERFYARKQLVTYRLDAAIRTPNRNSLWTLNDAGKRGAAPGGLAVRLAAAFSSEHGVTNPYVRFEYLYEGPTRETDLVDDSGATGGTGLVFNPADEAEMTAGVELVSSQNRDTESRFAIDLFLGFGYVSWQDIPSGLYLPSVLNSSKGLVVTMSEHVTARAGLGFDYHINRWVGLRVGGHFRYRTPYTIEHIYAARTGPDTFEIGAQASLEGRVRLRGD